MKSPKSTPEAPSSTADIHKAAQGGQARMWRNAARARHALRGPDQDLADLSPRLPIGGLRAVAPQVKLGFEEVQGILPCFTPGSRIATARGERRVEELKMGDMVVTRDRGLQKVRWVGWTTLRTENLKQQHVLRPVRLRAGSLGHGLPTRDMYVSPNHRFLFDDAHATRHFPETEVLAAAKHLCRKRGIEQVKADTVTYIHFMCSRHELVLSDGLWSESFQAGDYTLSALDAGQRAAVLDLFPELRGHHGIENFETVRRSLNRHEARLLFD